MEHLQNQFFEREGVENWVQRMHVESNQCYKPEPTPFLAHNIAHPLVTLSVGNNYALSVSGARNEISLLLVFIWSARNEISALSWEITKCQFYVISQPN